MSNPWDRNIRPLPPDLSRRPQLDRERLNKPIPLKPTETYALLCIFDHIAANHPNGRINIAPMMPSLDNPLVAGPSVQIDLADFSGRNPAAAIILTKEHAQTTLLAMMKAYEAIGGHCEEMWLALRADPSEREMDIRFNFVDDAKE